MRQVRTILVVTVIMIIIITGIEAKKKKSKKYSKEMILRQKETNAVNFIRLAVMRIIYGIATRIGFGEQISDAMNGAFVPPGTDYEYDDFDDDDYDIDY
ncbi:uncharacterized protein LOC126879483 [Diabrotica virgifera virgifera]|uniref:Uncharacterized protein LOC114339434 n=1 Tax=Diabrotica virgifera virgifera TaxID=50390 RepID=A0A6P7G9U3_DIAVI|nr:uncharacterized protein LOC126879483 [Diabrotica virgifera virgifera]